MGFFDRFSRIRSLSISSREVCLGSPDRCTDTVRFGMRRVHCLLLAIRNRIVDQELVQFLSVAFRFGNPPVGASSEAGGACWFKVSRRALLASTFPTSF
jgi:hypothetical protein